MAESNDSESCVGFKRDQPEISLQHQQQSSDSVSAVFPKEVSEESKGAVSFPKEEQEALETSPKKKVKCSFVSISQKDQGMIDSAALNFSLSEIDSGFSGKTENFGVEVQTGEKIDEHGLFSGDVDGEILEKKDGEIAENCDSVEENKKMKCTSDAQLGLNVEAKEENPMGKSESLLEAEKKRLLAEIEAATVFTDKSHLEKSTGVSSFFRIDKKGNGYQEPDKPAENDGTKDDRLYASNAFVGGSLKFQVIDDTALIDTVPAESKGNGISKKQDIALSEKCDNGGKPVHGKQTKRSRRKGKAKEKDAKMVEGNRNLATPVIKFHNASRKNINESKIVYSKQELEAMRFANTFDQRKLWRDLYSGLAPEVAKEYSNLANWKNQKDQGTNFDRRQPILRRERVQSILGKNVENEIDYIEDNEKEDANRCENVLGEDCVVEEECVEEDDSDDDYNTILRPAFAVDGEPDFDSGPPEDGFEYLRRVRWEAAQIPNVRVANIDKSKYVKREQSVYMPQIPEIPKCPEHLLPLKQWEDTFLSDFSKLRLALSGLDVSSSEYSSESQPMFIGNEDNNKSNELRENFLAEKFNSLNTKNTQDLTAQESSINQPFVNPSGNKESPHFDTNPEPKTSMSTLFDDYPTLSAICGMDSVRRVLMLRKRISAVETMSGLSRNDSLWLFALCAAVETPLDADTCASLRSLLRKCCRVRAAKSEVDDEVVMANVLATITGRYFGQLES